MAKRYSYSNQIQAAFDGGIDPLFRKLFGTKYRRLLGTDSWPPKDSNLLPKIDERTIKKVIQGEFVRPELYASIRKLVFEYFRTGRTLEISPAEIAEILFTFPEHPELPRPLTGDEALENQHLGGVELARRNIRFAEGLMREEPTLMQNALCKISLSVDPIELIIFRLANFIRASAISFRKHGIPPQEALGFLRRQIAWDFYNEDILNLCEDVFIKPEEVQEVILASLRKVRQSAQPISTASTFCKEHLISVARIVIAGRMKFLRFLKGLGHQSLLAKQSGISRFTLTRVEAGLAVSPDTFDKLASALQVPNDYLTTVTFGEIFSALSCMGEGNRLDCPILARWKSERLSPYLYRGAVDGYVGVTERALSFIDSFDCDVGSPEIRAEVLCHDLIETLRGYGLQDGFDVSLCGRYLTDQLFAIAEEELSRESNKPMDGKRTPYLRNDSGLAFNLFDT